MPQRRLRQTNDRAFCQLLVEHGPLTRRELARATHLSAPAATKIVNRLLADGIVTQRGEVDNGRPGPRAEVFEIAPELALTTAVEVHAREIVVRHHNLAQPEPGPVHSLALDRDDDLADQVVAAARYGADPSRFRHHGVCIAVPGVLDPATADVARAIGLEQWSRGDTARIQHALGRLVSFENDVNLHAVAERLMGAARNIDDFVLVSYGAGIGAAVVMDGRVRTGAHGAAGEISMLPTRNDLVHYLEVAQAWSGKQDLVFDPVDWASRIQDQPADWDAVAEAISRALVSLTLLVDPQAIVLAGRMARSGGEHLRGLVERRLAAQLAWHNPDVLLSRLDEHPVLAGALARAQVSTLDSITTA